MENRFDAEAYIVNGVVKALTPRPKINQALFVGIDGRETSHQSIGNQLLAAINNSSDRDNFIRLKDMARRRNFKSKKN